MALQLACKATSRACNKAQQRTKLETTENTVLFCKFGEGEFCLVVYLISGFLRLMLQLICDMSELFFFFDV